VLELLHKSVNAQMKDREGGNASETSTLIVRSVIEKVDNLTSLELSRLTNADLELARRTFGDSNVAIILGELDGECI
jgi:hypothetical protein